MALGFRRVIGLSLLAHFLSCYYYYYYHTCAVTCEPGLGLLPGAVRTRGKTKM